MCNKLANRHVRVGLANPSDVPRCDICENGPGILFFLTMLSDIINLETTFFLYIFFIMVFVAFFYCEVDGTSLCLQCDMIIHVGGKRTHKRYLVLRQRIEVYIMID